MVRPWTLPEGYECSGGPLPIACLASMACNAGIEGAYTWPPLASYFEDRPRKHNGTALGTLSAGTVAVPTYVLVARGMQGTMQNAASIGQPAKVESFAQLAKSIAPGYADNFTPARINTI